VPTNKEKDNLKEQLKVIQANVERMVKLFKRSKFFLSVANKMSYEEGTTFNDTNVVQYLAELEEYISSLITYAAFRKDEPYAAISAIPLEKLNKKDFDKHKFNIDAPIATQLEGAADAESTDDEPIISSSELYTKFKNLVANNKISFISRSTAKQPVNPHLNRNQDS
jgi:hypothetical protein